MRNDHHHDNSLRLRRTIERDADYIRRRFWPTMKRHQLDLRGPVEPSKTDRQPVEPPPGIREGFQRLHERSFYSTLPVDDATPAAGRPVLDPAGVDLSVGIIGVIATECVLEHNLRLCGAMVSPTHVAMWGEGDAPYDLDEKWRVDELDIVEHDSSYHFVLTCDLPFGQPPDEFRASGTRVSFRYVFPVGSQGRYCFYPLITCLGNATFTTATGQPGYVATTGYFTVCQGNQVLGISWPATPMYSAMQPGDVIPISVDGHDLGFDTVTVDLDPELVVAEVDVELLVYCIVGDDTEGQFVFDFANQGGEIRCDSVKWGKNRPVLIRDSPW